MNLPPPSSAATDEPAPTPVATAPPTGAAGRPGATRRPASRDRRRRLPLPVVVFVAVLAAAALLVGCGDDDDDVAGTTVDAIVEGDVARGEVVELTAPIVSAVEGANDGTFSFFVAGADDRVDPLFVRGVSDLDGAGPGDTVTVVGVVETSTVSPDAVEVVATSLDLVAEGELDEGDFDEKTDEPDPDEVERDDPVDRSGDEPVGPDSDIPSGGEGVPQDPAGEAGQGPGPDVGDE